MTDAKLLHRVIRRIAGWAVTSFFTEIHVIGGENVPEHGPIIVTATHHNMMLDPAILSCAFPYGRILHYWAKASLFAHPVLNYVLTSAGNIAVDRKSHDRQKLFRGTFEALSEGHSVALFPEGTSYTETRIMQVKDGAAWAALEYTKWAKEKGIKQPSLKIVPAAIVYTDKSKYRSQVIMELGQPITPDDYMELFLSDKEGASRAAVKHLTATIERKLMEATINAPDWDTLYAARMARDLLWEEERSINLDEFVAISQTLVDLFATPDLTPRFNTIKRQLLTYYSLLQSSHLTNSSLSSLPLPLTLDPHRPVTLPSRLRTLSWLVAETLAMLVRLPFFVIPLIVHAPAYAFAYWGATLVEDEEETQAQNKVVFGLLLLILMYGSMGVFVWSMLKYTPLGAFLATAFVTLFARYHNSLINYNYEQAKRLLAAWRILVGVWAPKHWDLSLHALSQYTIPKIPPENPWIDRTRSHPNTPRPSTPTPSSSASTPGSSEQAPVPTAAPSKAENAKKKHHPPSRRLVRHVLRARIEAAKALKTLFEQLELAPDGKRVRASSHLARAYGGMVDAHDTDVVDKGDAVEWVEEPRGWRYAREVVGFLRRRGAKIAQLEHKVEGDWAALSSEGEGTDAESDSGPAEDIMFVPSGSNLKEVLYKSPR